MIAPLLFALTFLSQEATPPKEAQPAASTTKEEPATKAELPYSVEAEVGYRVLPVLKGNFNTYRSLVNLGEGPRLLSGAFTYNGKTRLAVSGSGLGDPFHTFRVNAFREGLYEATFTSRAFLYYNFLPSFGNALLDRGILTPQRAYDVNRNWMDLYVRFRPGHAFTPYFGYSRDRGNGTGITNWVANGNEYPLYNDTEDLTNRYRGGVRYETQRYHLSVEQGGTQYDETQLSSTNQRTFGTRLTPILDRTLFLNNGDQLYRVRGTSVFTSASGSASVGEWLGLTGQFLYVNPEIDSTLTQKGNGLFFQPGTAAFLTTQSEALAGQASMPRSSGIYTVTVSPWSRLRILHSLWTDRYHTAGSLAISDLITPTSSASFNDRLEFTYNREQTEAQFDVSKALTVRAGHRYTWGNAKLRSPLSTPATTPNPELSLQSFLAGAMIRNWRGLWLNADYERGTADRVYFRTSLNDFSKGTLRARYRLNPAWQLGWNTVVLDNQNPLVQLDFRHTQNGLNLVWTPKSQKTSVIADYTRSSLRSTIPYLLPSTQDTAISNYRDNAHTATLMVDVKCVKDIRFTAGGAYVKTSGSRPSSFPQPEARVYVPLHKMASVFGEWRYWGYGQPFYRYESFRAHQLTIGLRLTR
jgi:hypothetical protein